jgi:hypothetical protein
MLLPAFPKYDHHLSACHGISRYASRILLQNEQNVVFDSNKCMSQQDLTEFWVFFFKQRTTSVTGFCCPYEFLRYCT